MVQTVLGLSEKTVLVVVLAARHAFVKSLVAVVKSVEPLSDAMSETEILVNYRGQQQRCGGDSNSAVWLEYRRHLRERDARGGRHGVE